MFEEKFGYTFYDGKYNSCDRYRVSITNSRSVTRFSL